MLHHEGKLLKPSCQQQKRRRSAVCAAFNHACALTCTEAPKVAHKRYRRRVSTGFGDQLPQQLISSQQPQQWVQSQQQGPMEQHSERHRRYALEREPRDINRLLTSMIMSATSWHDLQAIHHMHKHRLVPLHTAALLSKLAKVVNSCDHSAEWQQQQQHIAPVQLAKVQAFVCSELVPQLMSQAAELSPRGLANSFWALSKLHIVLEPKDQLLLQQYLTAAVPEMEPQHISSVLYSLAQQGGQTHALAASAGMHNRNNKFHDDSIVPRQLSVQQPQHVQSSSSAAAVSERQPLISPDQLVSALLSAAAHKLQDFGPQALSNTLYSAALMQHVLDNAWLLLYWDVSARRMPAAQQQHLSNMAWAAAVAGLSPPDNWRDAWMCHSNSSLNDAVPQGLSNSLWAIARLGWAGAALTPGTQGETSSSSTITSWLGRFCTLSIGQLGTFTDQALSICCWAVGSIAQQLKQQSWQQGQARPGLMSSTVLQQLLQQTGWQQQLLQQLQPRLLGFNPQQLSNTVWGLASSGLEVPAAWLEAFVRASGPKLTQFSPQELSGAVVALARLRHNPGPSWMNLFGLSVQRRFKTCDSQVMSNVVWAMLQLQYQPSERWLHALLLEVHARIADTPAAAVASAGHATCSSSSSNRYTFTAKGLSVLLLCLSQLSASRGSTCSPDMGRLWHTLGQRLLVASCADDVLPGITSQGLCYMAGAAALSDQQQVGQQLVLATMRQLLDQQQQQSQRSRPTLFGEIQDHQQQQEYAAARGQSQQQLSIVNERHITGTRIAVADVCMMLWAAARLEMQPPVDLVMPLLDQLLHSLQDLSTQHQANLYYNDSSGAQSSARSSTSGHWHGGDVSDTINSGSADDSAAASSVGPGLKHLGALMYALGFIGFDPGSLWFRSWFRATRPLLKECGCWTLAMLLWGAVYLEEVPPSQWLRDWSVAWGMQQQPKVPVPLPAVHDAIQHRWQRHKQQSWKPADSIAAEVAIAAGRQGLRVVRKAAVVKELKDLRDVQELRRLCLGLVRQGPAT